MLLSVLTVVVGAVLFAAFEKESQHLSFGDGFVAPITGSFAQRFLAPEIAVVEEQLEGEKLTAEELALRELRSVQEQLQALEVAVEQLARNRTRD